MAVKTETLAQLGAMLTTMEKNTGTKGIGISLIRNENGTLTLSKLEVDKKTSMVGQ